MGVHNSVSWFDPRVSDPVGRIGVQTSGSFQLGHFSDIPRLNC